MSRTEFCLSQDRRLASREPRTLVRGDGTFYDRLVRRWKGWVSRVLPRVGVESGAAARLSFVRTTGPGAIALRQSARMKARLLEAVLGNAGLEARCEAAHALGFHCDGRIRRALIAMLADGAQPAALRATVTEIIAFELQFDRGRDREDAIGLFRRALRDPVPEVRFWSLYGLGMLGAREARDEVASLVDDVASFPGWWSVGDEARDVLAVFDGMPWPDRSARRRESGSR